MKNNLISILAVLAACYGAPAGFRTANAKAAAEAPVETPEDTSTLGLLCKGAGVDPADVRWRVQAGLDVKQAVDAAIAQKASASEAATKEGK